MSGSFLLLVLCILSGSANARPIHVQLRSIDDADTFPNSHVNVVLGVRNVTSSSAILDWKLPHGRNIFNFKISCNGHPKSQADAERTDAHSLEHVISDDFKDVHHLLIENLKPDYNYSCSLMAAAQHDGETPHQLIAPIQFTTLSISTKDVTESGSLLNFMKFTSEDYNQKSAYIVLGIGVPACIAIIAALVGICVVCRKCNAYRNKKNDVYRQVIEDKLNRKLKGVVYNPVAMEYTTKWQQPNDMAPPPTPKFQNTRLQKTGQPPKQPKLDKKVPFGRLSLHELQKTGQPLKQPKLDKKVPFGRLSLHELVERVRQVRMQSPFAEQYRHNDPEILFSSCSGSSIIISSSDSFDDTIRTQPVIPNMDVSTAVFKEPKGMSTTKRPSHTAYKTRGLRTSNVMPVLSDSNEQLDTEFQSFSEGSSCNDVTLPTHFPRSVGSGHTLSA